MFIKAKQKNIKPRQVKEACNTIICLAALSDYSITILQQAIDENIKTACNKPLNYYIYYIVEIYKATSYH